MKKYMKKYQEISFRSILLAVLIVLLAVGCNAGKDQEVIRQPADKNQEASTQALAVPTPEVRPEYVKYQGVEGRNALDLLKQTQKVTVKTYAGIGEFVDGINGVQSDSKHFWSFYVNGAQSTVGASTYTTKSTDIIEWRFEEIR